MNVFQEPRLSSILDMQNGLPKETCTSLFQPKFHAITANQKKNSIDSTKPDVERSGKQG
jgi:hypothetical protein